MVVLLKHKLTLQKNTFDKKNYTGHAEYFLHFVWKKSTFFSGRGFDPLPLMADISDKKSSFFLNVSLRAP